MESGGGGGGEGKGHKPGPARYLICFEQVASGMSRRFCPTLRGSQAEAVKQMHLRRREHEMGRQTG